MTALPKKLQAALDFIRNHTQEHGESPSYVQIATGLGMSVRSKASVHRLVGALAARNRLRWLPARVRSIELIPVSPILSIELPPHLYANVQDLARKAKVTPECIVVEAVRDGIWAHYERLRSTSVLQNVSQSAS